MPFDNQPNGDATVNKITNITTNQPVITEQMKAMHRAFMRLLIATSESFAVYDSLGIQPHQNTCAWQMRMLCHVAERLVQADLPAAHHYRRAMNNLQIQADNMTSGDISCYLLAKHEEFYII